MGWLSRLFSPRTPLIDAVEFQRAVARLPLLHGLSSTELATLHKLASEFMHKKRFTLVGGATNTGTAELAVALQASLLILHLDERSYRGWREIVLYPDAFIRPQAQTDIAGVVHHSREILSGEAWEGGPIILSVADVLASGQANGNNVVLHEFAHKLDMLNGVADGFPPLHRGMSSVTWERDFSDAFADFSQRVDHDEPTSINAYGATNPAEFFAVLTEVFFETPRIVQQCYPQVYFQLQQFYRQDPILRVGAVF